MKRYQREAKKIHYETQRRKKVAEAEQRRLKEAEQAAKIKKVLVRGKSSPQKQVEEALNQGPTHRLFSHLRSQLEWGSKDRRDELLRFIAKEAPRLILAEMLPPLLHLTRFEWLRPLEEWKPAGKSKETVFRSLAEHLLAKYPTPHFLWSTFFYTIPQTVPTTSVDLPAITAHVAGGGALYDVVKKGQLPLPLTRRQCHDFLQTTSDYSFVNGLRRIQVLSHGGDQRLYRIWINTEVAPLQKPKDETFWDTVLRFFAQNPLLDPSQISPLIDYIRYQREHVRRTTSVDFSMKGRTAASLLRDMEAWHGRLAKDRQITGEVFVPSGFKPGSYERTYKEGGRKESVTWTVTEILTAKELAAEGRALHHCVYSYARSISAKHTSIWSLRANNERVTTIEVVNGAQKIVQYRGNYNAMPKAREFQVLQAWATENGLTIASSRW